MKTINNDRDNLTMLTELFVEVCESVKTFGHVPGRYPIGERGQRPFRRLGICEIMTILIAYQMIGYQNSEQY